MRLSEEESTVRRGSSASRRSASSGSIGLGALAGFLLLVFLGFIPIVGALIAGFVAGLIARGAGRGAVAGFVAGILRAVILALFLAVGGGRIRLRYGHGRCEAV